MILLVGCAVVPTTAEYQQKYFPEGINDVYLGMTYRFLDKTREGTGLELVSAGSDSTILAYQELHTDKEFEKVVYFFDNEGDQPLYEMAIEYPENINPEEVAGKLYGRPNADEGEWYFEDERQENRLSIWVNGQQLFISDRSIRQGD